MIGLAITPYSECIVASATKPLFFGPVNVEAAPPPHGGGELGTGKAAIHNGHAFETTPVHL